MTGGGGGGGGVGIGLSLIQVTLLLSRTVVPIIISMLLERILSLGLQILPGFSLLALPGTTLDQRCRLLIGTIRFGFPKPAIRRHAFIVWLAVQKRLVTQDKLLKWGLTNSMSCVFCRADVEDRNHLFFGCQFTAGIWLRILRLFGFSRMPRNWENEFLWVIANKGKSFCSITRKIAWGATIYHLWGHRNSRIQENNYAPADTIFHLICDDVRLRISGLQKVVDSPANRSMCERWSLNILSLGRVGCLICDC